MAFSENGLKFYALTLAAACVFRLASCDEHRQIEQRMGEQDRRRAAEVNLQTAATWERAHKARERVK